MNAKTAAIINVLTLVYLLVAFVFATNGMDFTQTFRHMGAVMAVSMTISIVAIDDVDGFVEGFYDVSWAKITLSGYSYKLITTASATNCLVGLFFLNM